MSSNIFKFENGDRVKDAVTGFKGVIIGRTQWLNGCIRYVVQPEELHEGKVIPAENVDQEQMVAVGQPFELPKQEREFAPGGPMPAPERGHTVR